VDAQVRASVSAEPILARLPPAKSIDESSLPPLDPKILGRPPGCPPEVTLTDPTTVRELAAVLHAQFYQVIAVLMQHDIFASLNTSLDFATASLVCAHYGVTPHKVA
jgi:hypothetical protein